MFFEDVEKVLELVKLHGCTILVMPVDSELPLKADIRLEPGEKTKTPTINVEQVRELMEHVNHRESRERFFVFAPADAMNEAAQNAMLKTLEEPHENCHFVLLTEHPNRLLPTIRSRSQIFTLRNDGVLDRAPEVDEETLSLAKKLIAADNASLLEIAAQMAKAKSSPREKSLAVVDTAIETLYKSYFKTGNVKFLAKLPKLITLYDNLSNNGHVNLHLVADLL